MKQESNSVMNYATEQNNLLPANYSAVRNLIETQPISMAAIGKTEGNELVQALLIRLVEGLASSYNVAKNMDVNQIQECANLLYQNYYHYSVQHFKTAFDRFKMNKYPDIKIYDRFDLSIVFAIIEKFDAELKEMRTKVEQEKIQKQQLEWEQNSVEMPDEVKEELEKLKLKFLKPAFVSNVQEPKEWTITQKWLKEFDDLYRSQGSTASNGVRFVKIGNDFLNQTSYLEYKLNLE
jgi:hypothetical protein